MKTFTIEEVLAVYRRKNYVIEDLPFEINLFGVRNNDNKSNSFDDVIGLFYRDEKKKYHMIVVKGTTDPGLYWRTSPITPEGTGIMVPGQYLNCYKVGQHKGYPAIEQCAAMKYVRDNNKDGVLDLLYKLAGYKYTVGNIKSNIHHAGENSVQVDKWSAACQVVAALKDWSLYFGTVQSILARSANNNLFNYALLEIEDFV